MADAEFQDKVVIVTGAGSGIGYATARRFADSGAIVGLNDVNPERAYDAACDFNETGGRCEPLVFDVTAGGVSWTKIALIGAPAIVASRPSRAG